AVRFFPEVRARNERLLEVLWVVDDGRHREPLIAVRFVVAVEVLGDHRALAVRDAVLPQVSGFQVRRDDLEGAEPRRRRRAAPTTRGVRRAAATLAAAVAPLSAGDLPRRDRVALPPGVARRWLRGAEVGQP